jgi:hypothetical protein
MNRHNTRLPNRLEQATVFALVIAVYPIGFFIS